MAIPPTTEQLALFEASYRPQKPLCGPSKTGPYKRRARTAALSSAPYIETNPACIQSLIITDVDAGDVSGLPQLVGLPPASWSVRTRNAIGSGHIGYALATPVVLTDAAHRRPINLLARVEQGLRDVLGGDAAYAGRIMKNPVSPGLFQDTLWPQDVIFPTYTLRELASSLADLGALPSPGDPRPRQSGVGRNVDVFDRTRAWSYRAIKRYWSSGFSEWSEVVHAKSTILNLDLEREGREPLPDREILHLARSISKWVWSRFTPEAFSEIQAQRVSKRWDKELKELALKRLNETISRAEEGRL